MSTKETRRPSTLDRLKRRLSRQASIPETPKPEDKKNEDTVSVWPVPSEDGPNRFRRVSSLTPSDEQLISRLTFSEDTKFKEGRPPTANPSIYSKASAVSERTVFNDTDRGFLSLPTEILLFLQPYLRPSGEVALRHTCSRFYYLFNTPAFYLSGDERFEYICMTERDQDPTQLDRLVCGQCLELHPRSTFPSAEVRQPPLDRDCRQLWLCPHKGLGYQKTVRSIKPGVESPFRAESIDPCSRCRELIRNRSIADRPEKGTATTDLESPNTEAMLVSKVALLQRPTPSSGMRSAGDSGTYKEVFLVRDVAAALQAIDFRICPHLKLGDPYLLSRFCRSCINTQRLPPGVKGPPCISEAKREFGDPDYLGKCRQTCWMRGCKTKFMFQARESLQPDASGRHQIWLIMAVYRWLGPLRSTAQDSCWRDHAVDHTERTVMRKSWDKWTKASKDRRPMPNWQICLYNPEDCNLRP